MVKHHNMEIGIMELIGFQNTEEKIDAVKSQAMVILYAIVIWINID